jgi:3-oxoacyl-(acyl-carrier-protein) synthase
VSAAFVRSIGIVSGAGTGVDRLCGALADPTWQPRIGLDRPDAPPLAVVTCHEFSARDHLPPLVARRLDRPARLLAVAAREAFAGGGTLPSDRDRIGVTAGTWTAGTEALFEVLRVVFLASPDEAPPMQFPSTVANAPASQLALLEKLGGPNVTFAEKQVGGLRAISEAARLLTHGRADAVLAAGVDEAQWLNAEGFERLGSLRRPGRAGMVMGEGAGCLLLGLEGGPDPYARILGAGSSSAIAPPHLYPRTGEALLRASRQALESAAIGPDEIDLVVSCSNGLPTLARLERDLWQELFRAGRPPAVVAAERLGDGAFGGAARVVIAALLVSGRVSFAWGAPEHLADLASPLPTTPPRTALVVGQAGGGSAIALILSAP